MTDLHAGPELDRLIAEKVIGSDMTILPEHQWRREGSGARIQDFEFNDIHHGPKCDRCGYFYCVHCDDFNNSHCALDIPIYSTNITMAWKVVERLDAFTSAIQLERVDPHRWRVTLNVPRLDSLIAADAETAPLAICRAALKAIGQ